jgi:hypothetical protein
MLPYSSIHIRVLALNPMVYRDSLKALSMHTVACGWEPGGSGQHARHACLLHIDAHLYGAVWPLSAMAASRVLDWRTWFKIHFKLKGPAFSGPCTQ